MAGSISHPWGRPLQPIPFHSPILPSLSFRRHGKRQPDDIVRRNAQAKWANGAEGLPKRTTAVDSPVVPSIQ